MRRNIYYSVAVALACGILLGLSGCQGRGAGTVGVIGAIGTEAVAGPGQQEAVSSQSTQAEPPAVETTALELGLKAAPAITFEDRDETVYVTGDIVNIRAAATIDSAVVTTASKGSPLKRTGYSESFSRIELYGGAAYIMSKYVSVNEPTGGAANGSGTAGGTANGSGTASGTANGSGTASGTANGSGTASGTANGSGTAGETARGPSAAGGTASAPSASAAAGEVKLDPSWKYADFSKINSGSARLYRSEAANRKGITICVNAGHGTQGGGDVKTLCHPDGTPKVTGGTTSAGATSAIAVSSGMTFSDGTPEAKVTLAMAKVLKEKLLARGYDVLMIRETDDVQLDNIARAVIANQMADCHIALHWDSTTTDKGAFYMSVPNVSSYRNMEPVASNWQKHNALGAKLLEGLRGQGVKIWSGGSMEMDLTQTSYSTVPSVDVEFGDKASDHSAAALDILGNGIADGIGLYFE